MELSEPPSSEPGVAFAAETPTAWTGTKFQRYTPGLSSYSKRRTDEEWASYRQLLTQMHEQLYTRRQMIEALKARDFVVTSGQLFAQLKKWDLMVYGYGNRRTSRNTCGIATSAEAEQDTLPHQPELFDEFQPLTIPDFAAHHELNISGCHHVKPSILELSSENFNQFSSRRALKATPLKCSDEEQEKEEEEEFQYAIEDLAENNETAEDNQLPEFEHPEAADAINSTPVEHMANNESLLQQLPVVMETWCQPFPTTCCCQSFFNGIDSFATSPELYQAILRQSSPFSLAYVLALLNLAENQSPETSALSLKEPFWLAITSYLDMCTRPNHKNSLARSILYALLRAWENLSEERFSIPTKILALRKAESRSSLFARFFRMKSSRHVESSRSPDFDWEAFSERDIGALVGFVERKVDTFPLMNWSGQVFGNPATWSAPSEDNKPNSLASSARTFASILDRNWVEWQMKVNSPDSILTQTQCLGDCDWSLVVSSLGLMLALELDTYASDLIKSDGQLTDSATWSKELEHFIGTTINTMSLNAEHAEKFRKSYWLASIERIGHNGKGIHIGSCNAKAEWQILERDIREYDEERTWIERRLFSGSGSWPRAGDLITFDNASIKSVSSIDSFRRFQALAFHLKIGTPHSRSVRSKSTKSMQTKMSLDSHLSWQLEHMLGLKEEEGTEEEILPKLDDEVNTDHEAQDTRFTSARTSEDSNSRLKRPQSHESVTLG